MEFCKEKGITYFEASAKENRNIEKIFPELKNKFIGEKEIIGEPPSTPLL